MWLSLHNHTSLSQGCDKRDIRVCFPMSIFKRLRKVAIISVFVFLIVLVVFSLFAQSSQLNGVAYAQTFSVPCTITTTGNAWDGNLTFGLLHYDSTNTSHVLQSYLVNMQTNGQLLNLRTANDSSGDYFEVKYISPNTVMFEGEAGLATHFWDLNSNQTVDFPNIRGYHHDICYNPVNGHFLMLKNYFRNVNGSYVLYDTIEEDDESGSPLWIWDEYPYFPLSWASKFNETVNYLNGTALDFSHCNAIMWDYQENVTYLNSRHLDTFFKINMTTGNVIWGCGKHGNFTLLSANGTVVSSLWYHSHSTQEIAPNLFMMFDNDYQNETNPNNAHSRMLMISLNETSMTAREVWSWQAPVDYWTTFFGKADVLPNGNMLGTFGSYTHPYNATIGAVIVEVNVQGQVVRTWIFPKYWAIYRVIPGGQIANALGIYPEPTVIPEFSSGPMVVFATTLTTSVVVCLKYKRRIGTSPQDAK